VTEEINFVAQWKEKIQRMLQKLFGLKMVQQFGKVCPCVGNLSPNKKTKCIHNNLEFRV
jgi:hypothetical protein